MLTSLLRNRVKLGALYKRWEGMLDYKREVEVIQLAADIGITLAQTNVGKNVAQDS